MVEDAKVICDTCNYRRECLEFALTTKQSDGVWGGINFSNTREFSAFKRNLRRYANK
jgi:WhiB family redox-sensing transcriptional regulator